MNVLTSIRDSFIKTWKRKEDPIIKLGLVGEEPEGHLIRVRNSERDWKEKYFQTEQQLDKLQTARSKHVPPSSK